MTWALGGFGEAKRGRQRPQGKEGANGKAVERGNRVRGGGRHVWGTSMLQADTRGTRPMSSPLIFTPTL